jgi:hypothetical protein
MSLWNSFLDNIAKPAGKALASGGEQALGFIGQALPFGVPSPSSVISGIAIDAGIQMGVSPILNAQGLNEAAAQGLKENLKYQVNKNSQSNDITLKIAHNVVEPVISKGLRGVGTAALLSNPDGSPLTQPGEFEQGFQLNDIKSAWNRTEEVSVFQALTQSLLLKDSPLQNVASIIAGTDLSDVNLWDDEDIQKNFSDNIVGKIYTGGGDFVVSNGLITLAGGGIGRLGMLGKRAAGLSTTGKAITTFENEAKDGLLFIESNGTQGKFSNSASDVKFLADTNDVSQIIERLEPYTTNSRMIDVIRETQDPNLVLDLILADKQYLPAIERLISSGSAEFGHVAGITNTFKTKAIDNGGIYHPEGDALDRINKVYDNGIRTPEHKKYYETVMDPIAKSPRGGGKDYFPMEPKLGAQQLAALKNRISVVKSGAITRDFTDIGGWEERILGNHLVTRAIRFTGTYKPLGIVTFSGARPLDGMVEIHAMLDDLILFANGTNRITVTPPKKPGMAPETKSASQYRLDIINDFVKAPNDIARKAILEKIDENLGYHLAYSKGFYDDKAIKTFVDDLRGRIATSHASFAEKGMGIDAQGHRVTIDPQTQRQLVDSYRFGPWNIVEKEIIKSSEKGNLKKYGSTGTEVTKAIYEATNRYWTFDVLARPSYIPKQSIAEPLLSAYLATGIGFILDTVPSMARNSIKNNRNRVLGTLQSIKTKGELKSYQKLIDAKGAQLDAAVVNLNSLNSEFFTFFETQNLSPMTRSLNGPKVLKDLRAAERLVDEIELDLMAAIKPHGDYIPVATFSGLDRRIKYLSDKAGGKYGNQIAEAKFALNAARAETHTLIPNSSALAKVNNDIAEQYEIIENLLKELGEKNLDEARLLEKGADYTKRYYGKEEHGRWYKGNYYQFDALFNKNQKGDSLREELSNTATVGSVLLNETNVGTRQSILMRKSPNTITDVNNPLYFPELEYIVNRQFRGDPLVDQILAQKSPKELIAWAKANPAYIEQFGVYTEGTIPDFVRARISLINRYLPSKEAQEAALKAPVTANQLKLLMSKNLDELSAIHPTELNYQLAADGLVSASGLSKIDKSLADFSRFIFRKLAAPENPIRWSFADKIFSDIMVKKADVLKKQGVEITDVRMNALRQSATREVVAETEKTFYTIRRQNRGIYASRVLTAFPAASMNAFYRYGRLAIKNPTRVAGFLHSYNSMFTSFGIDKNGEPVTNPLDATHIVLPLSKELGLFGGKGVRLSARSIGFLLNIPGPSFISALSVGTLQKWKPSIEDTMKDVLGDTYDMYFPYGTQTSLSATLTPVWGQSFYKYLVGPDSQADFLNSVKSVADYYHTLEEMGIQKYPGDDVIKRDVQKMYGVKAQWQFASIFGVPIKVDTDPMQLYTDYYKTLVNKWITTGNNEVDAKFLAEREMLSTLGADFPLDRVTYNGKTQVAYVPSTLKTYNRVFEDNPKLTNALAKIDPKLVSLLFLDVKTKPEEFNLSIYKILNDPDTKLPGNIPFNKIKLSAEQYETERQINRAQIKFNEKKDKLNAQALAQGRADYTSVPQFKAELESYAKDVLQRQSPDWFNRYNNPTPPNYSFNYATGLETIINNVEFMTKYGDTKTWQDVSNFVSMRNQYVDAYQALQDRDPRKKQLVAGYQQYLIQNTSQFEPAFQEIIRRYFAKDKMDKTIVGIN